MKIIFFLFIIFITSCESEVKVSTICGDGKIEGLEECDDGNTDNGDGCSKYCTIEYGEDCTNGIDDNVNGFPDCLDPLCWEHESCTGELCNNGYDDDNDGLVDCMDPDCELNASCTRVENCSNNFDDDQDGLTDCADDDCLSHPLCGGCDPDSKPGSLSPGASINYSTSEGTTVLAGTCIENPAAFHISYFEVTEAIALSVSGNVSSGVIMLMREEEHDITCELDNLKCAIITGDSTMILTYDPLPPGYYRLATDFEDSVDLTLVASNPTLENCTNGWDDDGDFLADCDDPDCADKPACTPEDCFNGIDDDLDGKTDCADDECTVACAPPEDCTNGIDDDLDSSKDCQDLDCLGHESCTGGSCTYFYYAGTLSRGSTFIKGFDTTLTENSFSTPCGGIGPDWVMAFDLDSNATINIHMTQSGQHALALAQESPGNCAHGVFACQSTAGVNMPVSLTATNIPPGRYYIISDAIHATATGDGTFTVQIVSPDDEICFNGIDDDGDGLIDCDDEACADLEICRGESSCHDGIDNDSDGLLDCSDPDCIGKPECSTTGCTGIPYLGTLGSTSPLGYTMDLSSATTAFDSVCDFGTDTNTGYVLSFNLSIQGRLRLRLLPENFTEAAAEIAFPGGGTSCSLSPYMCINQSAPGIGTIVVTDEEFPAGGPYFIRIMPFIPNDSGTVQILLQYEN